MKKSILRYFVFTLLIAIPFAMFSCYPGGLEYYSDTDIVVTNYDEGFNFSNNKLYFMPDTIHHVVEDGKEDEVDRTHDAAAISLVATNLDAAGYTRLENPSIPDSILVDSANVVVALTAFSTTYSGTWWYGGGWWGGYYPGWGWGGYYPGYPWYGYPVTYSYSAGTLLIEMVNEDGISPANDTIPVIWQATMNGLLSGNEQNMLSRVENSINQSFEQSPYLSK